ncbi:MAG: hypothetical protein EXR72_07860 [Myxococcales bacterium]|nr:hypothetical protein [Myxococcales bacterium]
MRPLLLALGSVSLALGACGGDGRSPTARIALAPLYVPLGDGYRTEVRLDGRASRNDLEDPEGTRPLRFLWELDDVRPQIVDGALDAALVTVRVAAPRPTTVRLTVTDPSGAIGRATARIGVTVDGG